MEKQLSWVVQLPLEEMALRRVVVNLWVETVILVSVENSRLKSSRGACGKVRRVNAECRANDNDKVIEDVVKDNVLKLVLPELLKKRLMLIVRPIGSELLKWQIYHEKILGYSCEDIPVCILKRLCWTSTGVIDYRKTAEELLRHEILDVAQRYKLACLHCMVDYIPLLWKELPEETKERFYEGLSFSMWKETQLETYWAYILRGEESELESKISRHFSGGLSFYKYAFEGSARNRNKAACEYFFSKLANQERKSALFRTTYFIMTVGFRKPFRMHCDFPKEKLSDIICYFLSVMTPEEQMKVLMEHPCEMLGCLLVWPWQGLFLDVADIIWTFLPECRYDNLLFIINDNIKHSGYYFPNLIQEFFQRSPSCFKKRFVNHEYKLCYFFPEFFAAEDAESIKVVFRHIDAKDRAKLVSSYRFYQLFDGFMRRNKWQLVKLCLQEASLSREDKERLKKAFRGFVTCSATDGTFRWKVLFEFLDKIGANSPDKRSSEDEAQTKIKKLCEENHETAICLNSFFMP